MREIVFRAKRKDNGEWVYGSLLIQAGERINKDELTPAEYRILGCRGENHLVDPKTVGEYTGLTGGKGTKIFEGDIVKHIQEYEISDKVESIAVIKWNEAYTCWSIEYTNGRITAFLGMEYHRIEVIGNIHDNPELLKE